MKRILSLVAIGMLGACSAAAQEYPAAQSQPLVQINDSAAQASGSASASVEKPASMPASANPENNSWNLADGTKIDASLATSLDVRHGAPGDEVEVRTEEDIRQDGKVVMKRGTHLVGHVTQSQVRTNGQAQSQLGIVFDHAVLKNGQQVPFSASILAMASAQPAAGSRGADATMGSGGQLRTAQGMARGGALVGGATSAAGATTGAMMNTSASLPSTSGETLNSVSRSSGAAGGLTPTGRLASNSSGVFGLEGLSIDSAAASATKGSLIVSRTKNIHLDSGTQLLLRTGAQAQ